jgi:threonine dehydrogenase-like Zn-dependent dehydrogenase
VTDGPKPQLVRDLGATYHHEAPAALGFAADVVIECTGYGPLVFELVPHLAPDAVMCLTGIAGGAPVDTVDESGVNKNLVLNNGIVFGSVNAARRHYEQAAEYLRAADREWLARLLTRRVPMADWPSALRRDDADVKVVVDLTA